MKPLSIFVLLPIIILGLSSCSSVKNRDRVGVIEAKSCVKQRKSDNVILDRYRIKACANNGIWLAVNIDTNEQYDFLNKIYTNPQNETIGFSDLNDNDRAIIVSLQKKINAELLDLY